jgi:hypothetical protein
MKVGDFGFIVGSKLMTDEKWRSSFPNNWFGKIIDIRVRYSPLNGKKLEPKIIVRCYRKGSRPHMVTSEKYFKLFP